MQVSLSHTTPEAATKAECLALASQLVGSGGMLDVLIAVAPQVIINMICGWSSKAAVQQLKSRCLPNGKERNAAFSTLVANDHNTLGETTAGKMRQCARLKALSSPSSLQ